MSTNVGSVVASIVPDVSDFASRADAALTPSVARLGENLGRALSRSLTQSLDFSGIDNALRRSLDAAEASAASKGAQIGRRYGQAMRAGLDSELRGLRGDLDVTVRPVIDRSAYRAVMTDLDVLTRTRTVVINANADTTAAAAQLSLLTRDRRTTIHANVNGSQVARASSLISRITGVASSAGGAIGGLASKVLLLGSAAPVVGAVANTVAAIAPAAALALPAVAAVGSAIGAVKVGTAGLSDAFSQAFNPTTPEAYAEAMAKLSPQARALVEDVASLKPAWESLRLDVQDRLLNGIGGRLTDVGSRVLPILESGLEGTAGVLNQVAKNALTAVDNLARTGMLKQVFDGATKSLSPLSRIPAQLVTAFGQVAVAAQPAFQRITEGAAGVADKVSAKLTKAFKSGAMERAIDTAVSLLGELGDVGKNVFDIIGSIFEAGAGTDGGTLGVLETVTAEIAKVVSSPEVQGGLKALFEVTGEIATTVAPLLGSALKGVGVIVSGLGAPVQELVGGLGEALPGALGQLKPLMGPVADAGRQIWESLKPLAPLVLDIGSYLLNDLVGGLGAVLPMAADLVSLALVPIADFLGFVDEHKVLFGSVATGVLAIVLALKAWALWQKIVQLATLGWAAAQGALNLVMSANPIGLVILAIVGLAAGLIYAYKHSETFREIVKGAMKAVKEAALAVVRWFTDRFIPFFTKTIPDAFSATVKWVKDHWPLILAIITGPIGLATLFVVKHWGQIRDGISDAWKSIKSHTLTPMKTFFTDTIPGWARTFKDGVVGFFKSAVDGVKSAWGKLKDVAKAPVKFLVETVFNNGLRRVWNATAAKLPGIGEINEMKLPKGFARGGILPGYTPGRDVHRFYSPTGGMLDLSGGEAIMRPEVTAAVGRGGINALNAAARSGGVAGVQALLHQGLPHRAFWGGGIWDELTDNPVTNAVTDVVGKGVDLLEKGVDWARGGVADLAEKSLKTLLGVKSLTVDTKNQIWSKLVGNIPVVLADKVVDFIRGKEAEVGGGGSWVKPVNAAYGTKFGVKGHMWSSGYHTGLDFPEAVGTAIKAVAAGRVSSVSRSGPYGNHLTVDHGGGLSSLYAHMSEIVAKAKETISAGSLIGRVGSTGNTTGPHLHLEARVNGKPVDPMPYLTGGGSALNTPGSGVERWAGVVRQALGLVDQPSSLVQTTLRRMNQESGGNPRAVNKWDSNWQAGHPSVGLMQVIGPTFRAYAGRFKNKGPFLYGTSIDPLANVYSSMRYALAAYGSLSRAYNRPGGYAKGGFPSMGEFAWVGEEGPELVRFKRPAQVYPHQESMRIAQQMAVSAQVSMTRSSEGRSGDVNFYATTTDKPTRQTVMNALSDYQAINGSLVIA
ncbi:peptidoglycan DD-metalloendopeptidase family protein [Streptomyces sp. NPDC090106]|uniref:peptidoglycan DD-metalloendopeptidase family protein n=1 Tax=Streptomyces sp. NPDC090106 TaxID=3365946 RepID=UPI00381FDB45